jgi:hypothetical protein
LLLENGEESAERGGIESGRDADETVGAEHDFQDRGCASRQHAQRHKGGGLVSVASVARPRLPLSSRRCGLLLAPGQRASPGVKGRHGDAVLGTEVADGASALLPQAQQTAPELFFAWIARS